MVWDDYWDTVKDIQFNGNTFTWEFYKSLLNGESLKGKKVLEIGCGTGNNTIMMGKLGADITFLDMSQEALDIVEGNMSRAGVTGKLIKGDAFNHGLTDYDIVHSEGLIEHFSGEQRQKIVDIHTEALKPGGKAIIIVPNLKSPFYRLGKYLAQKTNTWIYGYEHPLSRSELSKRMQKAGLEVGPVTGGEAFFSIIWGFAPLWLTSKKVMTGTLSMSARSWGVKLNYNNFIANRWGRVIACVGVKK